MTEPGIETVISPLIFGKHGPETVRLVVHDKSPPSEKERKFLPAFEETGRDWAKGIGTYHFWPRGTASRRQWTQKSPPNYVERAHALLGQTVDQGRVRDIAATARFLAERGKGKAKVQVMGVGQAGILAAYAALFEPSITEVIVTDPPASHRDGPIFLNVLRVLDVPEALGLLAPRPLTLVGAKDKAFDRTAAIYKAAGAADKLKRK